MIVLVFSGSINLFASLLIPPQETGLKRVIIISFDACNADYLTPEYMPNLHRILIERGAVFRVAHGAVASETQGSHTVMLTGAHPNSTGLIGNGLYLNATGETIMVVTDPKYRLVETIFETIEPSTSVKTAFLSGKWRLRSILHQEVDFSFGSPKLTPDQIANPVICSDPAKAQRYQTIVGMPYYMNPDGDIADDWIVNSLIEVIKGDDPDLIFMNLAYLDVAQHYQGAYSAQIRSKLLELDQLMMKLFTELRFLGKFDSTLFIFTADHGQDEITKLVNIESYLKSNGIQQYCHYEGQSAFIYLQDMADKASAVNLLNALPDIALVLPRENMSDLHLDTFGNRTGDIYASASEHVAFGKESFFMLSNIGTHGGITCRDVPMAWMGPGIKHFGYEITVEVPELVDIVPTIGNLTGWNIPTTVDGRVLDSILVNSSVTWWS